MIYIVSMNENKFGLNLKTVRKKNGMTQKQLGEHIGVGQVAIANYEKGQRFPGEQNLIDLVKVLGVSLDSLMGLNRQDSFLSENIRDFSIEQLWNQLRNNSVDTVMEYLFFWQKERSWGLPDLYAKAVTPLLYFLGNQWQLGNLSIAEEHLFSGKIRTLILLLSHYSNKQRVSFSKERRWLGLCPPGENHDLGLLMLSGTMEYYGWEARNLGVNIPFSELLLTVEDFKPQVISFSCVNPRCLNSLEIYIRSLIEKRSFPFQIQIGGSGIHEDQEFLEIIDSVVYAENLFESVRLAEDALEDDAI